MLERTKIPFYLFLIRSDKQKNPYITPNPSITSKKKARSNMRGSGAIFPAVASEFQMKYTDALVHLLVVGRQCPFRRERERQKDAREDISGARRWAARFKGRISRRPRCRSKLSSRDRRARSINRVVTRVRARFDDSPMRRPPLSFPFACFDPFDFCC